MGDTPQFLFEKNHGINLKNTVDRKNADKSYVESGSKLIVEKLQKCFDSETASSYLCFFEFTTIVSSIGTSDAKMSDFLTIFGNKKCSTAEVVKVPDLDIGRFVENFSNYYWDVYLPLLESNLGVFYHPDFFHTPNDDVTPALSKYKNLPDLQIPQIIIEIQEKFKQRGKKESVDFKDVSVDIYHKNESFPLPYDEFIKRTEKTDKSYEIPTRCHLLHKLYNDNMLPGVGSDKSLLICLPIVGFPFANEYQFQGLGAVFIYLVGDVVDQIQSAQIHKVCVELDYFLKSITYYYSFAVAHDLSERLKEFAIQSALAAIMARNMSHNLGSHVLARIIRENPANPSKDDQVNNDQSKDDQTEDKSTHCDPIKLVLDDADEALDLIAKNSNIELESLSSNPGSLKLGSQIPRLGRAVHYLEEIYGLCNKVTGSDKVRIFTDDVKIFAAYLQQRADFIAQICTEWPHWTAPACLSNDLMAWFLKQRKVLNFIAASEGLKATTFKNNGNRFIEKPEAGKKKIGGHIGFVMRLITKSAPITIMDFTEVDTAKIVFHRRRIPVAFPGGRIGWDAFLIILEGFIRNTAKHAYSRFPDKDQVDLNVFIDIIDDGNATIEYKKDDKNTIEKPAYTVRIYSNVDQNKDGITGILNEYLAESFVDPTGKMTKKNWGLSEFRISAGYLQRADIMAIGGRQEKENNLLQVKSSSGNETKPKLFGDSAERFYYEFKMLKPRMIGMEVSKSWEIQGAQKFEGWEVYSSQQEAYDCDFDYYVLSDSKNEYHKWIRSVLETSDPEELVERIHAKKKKFFGRLDYYPGRLFVVLDEGTIAKNISKNSNDYVYSIWWRLRKRVCILSQQEFDTLQSFYDGKEGGTDRAALFLQQKWVDHVLRIIRGIHDKGLKLYHYLNEFDSSKNDESPYIPDTTPFQDNHSKSKAYNNEINESNISAIIPKPMTLISPNNGGKDHCAIVFGRHWGVLDKKEDDLFVRKDRDNRGYEEDTILYAESMSGGASYFCLAEDALRECNGDNLCQIDLSNEKIIKIAHARTVYQFAETALLRVVLIDERIQEQFDKQRSDQLVGVSEQQVYVGYLENSQSLAQTPPQGGLLFAGYIEVALQQDKKNKHVEVKVGSVMLNGRRERKELDSSLYSELWPSSGNFEGDVLIIHQGIIDKWYDSLPTKNEKNKKEDIENLIIALKLKFPYVIITSGRGRPDDVPRKVRFIPFSSFGSAPQGNLYEKHSLIQQVLAIVGNEKEE